MTLSTLAQNSEITILKASGMSAHRILAPLMIAASLLAVGHMAVNEFWTADATRKLTAWKDVDYASMPDGDTGAGRSGSRTAAPWSKHQAPGGSAPQSSSATC
ncbi:LptF/LptG family permease [Hankyongella ginsenosidimutans]|uniref:LptF/LptG family permease n=1 Tax=Hankyongella ginsenosidimutans TaxID=1763828 RepID=UPI001CA33C6B|nr:LptF/LptG family permease [Hankyongella ginsenosidimutans]